MNDETLIMNLIVDAGNARSYAMEAMRLAREGNPDEAEVFLQNAGAEMAKAHKTQTDLIQNEAKGGHTEMNLFMVHAQDHIMSAILAKDIAKEIVELYRKINEPPPSRDSLVRR